MSEGEDVAGREDGELEDGEWDGEDAAADNHATSADNAGDSNHEEKSESEGSDKEEGEGKDEEGQKKHRHHHKKKKDRRKRKRDHKDKKHKSKRPRYVDHDNVQEPTYGKWEGGHKNKNQGEAAEGKRSPQGGYDGSYEEGGKQGNLSPPGPYDSPYASPPGPYDSPSDEEGGDRYDDRPRRNRTMSGSGMMGDDYMDQDDGQQRGRHRRGGSNNRQRRNDKKFDKHRQNDHGGRKRLKELSMDERPNCKFYMEGKCAKGMNCPFNHDFVPPQKKEVCKFYLNTYCQKGDNCIFMHGEFPCKYYHTGRECFSGDNCKFSHAPLDDTGRMIIDKMVNEGYSIEDDFSSPKKKKMVKEVDPEELERIKKIPSLFDIEVFPPGQRPPNRPNFYNDTNNSSNMGNNQPGLLGPPPGLLGPRPSGPIMGGPNMFPNKNNGPGFQHQQQSASSPTDNDDGSQNGMPSPQAPAEAKTEKPESVNEDSQLSQDDSTSEGGIISHLPPKQRELFLRIQAQQKKNTVENQADDSENQAVDDDNWYSSDEEAGGEKPEKPKNKIADLLKTLSQQSGSPSSTSSPGFNSSPAISTSMRGPMGSPNNPHMSMPRMRMPQQGPNMMGGPLMGPNGPNMGPNGPNMGPNGPMMGPNGPNMGLMGPGGPGMGSGPGMGGPMGPNMGPGLLGPGPMGPGMMRGMFGPNNMGPNNMGPNNMGPNNMGPNNMGPNNMGPNNMGPNNMGPNNMGPNNMGPNNMGPNNMGPNMGPNNMGPNSMGPNNMGPNMGPNNMGPNNMGPNNMGPNNMGPNNMGPGFGVPQQGPGPRLDINAMLSALRNATTQSPSQNDQSGRDPRDPRQSSNNSKSLDPRDPRARGDLRSADGKPEPRAEPRRPSGPMPYPSPVTDSNTVIINSRGTAGTFPWLLRTVNVDPTAKLLSPDVNWREKRFNDDPRVKIQLQKNPLLKNLPAPSHLGGSSPMTGPPVLQREETNIQPQWSPREESYQPPRSLEPPYQPPKSEPQFYQPPRNNSLRMSEPWAKPDRHMDPRNSPNHSASMSREGRPSRFSDSRPDNRNENHPDSRTKKAGHAPSPVTQPLLSPDGKLPELPPLSHSDHSQSKLVLDVPKPMDIPKPLDIKLAAGLSDTKSPEPRYTRQNSKSDSSSSGDSRNLNYRNDPRFKKRPRSDRNSGGDSPRGGTTPEHPAEASPPPAVVTDPRGPLHTQRKANMDYTSPLEAAKDSQNSDSYDSYSRPPRPIRGNQTKKATTETAEKPPVTVAEVVSTASPITLTVPPENMDFPPVSEVPDVPLKDVFKTIDPTASPFC